MGITRGDMAYKHFFCRGTRSWVKNHANKMPDTSSIMVSAVTAASGVHSSIINHENSINIISKRICNPLTILLCEKYSNTLSAIPLQVIFTIKI